MERLAPQDRGLRLARAVVVAYVISQLLGMTILAAAVFLILFLLSSYVVAATANPPATAARALLRPPGDPLRGAREVLRRPGPLAPFYYPTYYPT